MRLSSNIMRFYPVFGIRKTIDLFSRVGINAIDFNCDIKEFHDGTYDKSFYTELKEYANSLGVIFGQTHAPFASGYVDAQKNEKRFEEIVTSMRYSSYLEAPYMVVHPCQQFYYSESNKDAIYEYNLNFYRKFIPYYEEYGVKIAIENINYQSGVGVTSTPESLAKIFDELDNEAFSVCFDVGHVNIIGIDPGEAIRTLGSRIGCLHVHDNDGAHDTHTLPYYGTIKWGGVTEALAAVGYSGTLNYEASGFVAKLPTELYEEGARFMSLVGHSLIDSILSQE